MQSVSSRIWTRVAVSISYSDNHYTTDTSNCFAQGIITACRSSDYTLYKTFAEIRVVMSVIYINLFSHVMVFDSDKEI